jgi:hypothetical protein
MGQFLEKEVSQPINESRDKPLLRMQAVATACVYFRRFYSRFDNKHLLLTHKKLGSQSENPGKYSYALLCMKNIFILLMPKSQDRIIFRSPFFVEKMV